WVLGRSEGQLALAPLDCQFSSNSWWDAIGTAGRITEPLTELLTELLICKPSRACAAPVVMLPRLKGLAFPP
ncbi:MAG: hypothetical protein EB123_06540, partial [Synechococcaceae bacterium WBB_32_011]|nr:hypothetical protein [Synechococcaceae bacterium WBB_32_011]